MKDLTKGNIYKTFLLFAIPMVLSSMLSQAYSTINTIMAGKLLGDGALAATGAVTPFSTFLNSAIWGYGMGVGIYVSHLFGAKDYRGIKHTVISNFSLVTIVLLAITVLTLIFRFEIYDLLNVDPAILEDSDRYFIIITLGRTFVLFAANCVYVFHAIGDSAFPLFVSTLSALLNIGIGAASILLFGLGVEGLALGTGLAAVVSTVIYIFKLRSVFRQMHVQDEKVPFRFGMIRKTCRYALTTMSQQAVMYFGTMFLSPMINGIGSAASASYTVANRIYDINAAIYINSSKTVGSYTAQCYGAKKYHLIKKGMKVGVLQSLVLVMPVLLSCSLFARPVSSLFFAADADATAVNYTIVFLRYFLPFLAINVFANLFHNFFRGMGKMRALFITTLAGTVARVIVSGLLIGPYGVYGYYAGWVFAWVFDAAVGAGIYFFGNWKKQLLQEMA